MEVGVDRRADGERRVEALAVGRERQHERPSTRRDTTKPVTAYLDAVLSGVAARGDDPRVGVGYAAEHVGLADLPTHRGRHRVGEWPRQRTETPTRLRQQVQQAEFLQHVAVPIGRRPHQTGQSPDAIGEAAGLRVDEARRQLVPRRVPRERRVGEPRTQAVVEPPVELGEPGEHPLDALVA